MIILMGILDSIVLALLIVLIYFRGYKLITDRVILFTMDDIYTALAVSSITIALLVIIFSTRFSDLFFNFIKRHRNPIPREQKRLLPLINEVQEKIHTKIQRRRIKIAMKIKDEDTLNSSSIGVKTIAINRKLYEQYDDPVLKGVIAYELGNLYDRWSCKKGILMILSFMYKLMLGILWAVAIVSWTFGRESKGCIVSRIIGFSAYLISILAAGVLLCGITGYLVFHILLKYYYRKMDFRADNFAISIGYKDELLRYLENNKDEDYLLNSWIKQFINLRPKKILRIGNIEKVNNPNE